MSLRWKLILKRAGGGSCVDRFFPNGLPLLRTGRAGHRATVLDSSTAPDRVPIVARAWLESNQLEEGKTFEINLSRSRTILADDIHEVAIESLDSGSRKWKRMSGRYCGTTAGLWCPITGFLGRWSPLKGATGRFRCLATPKATGAYSTGRCLRLHDRESGWSAVPQCGHRRTAACQRPLVSKGFSPSEFPSSAVITALILPICLGMLAWYLPHLEAGRVKRDQQVAEKTAQAQETLESVAAPQPGDWAKILFTGRLGYHANETVCGPSDGSAQGVPTLSSLVCATCVPAVTISWRPALLKPRGEYIASDWWAAISGLVARAFPLEVSEAVLDRFGTRESYSRFIERFEKNPENVFNDPKAPLAFALMEGQFNEWRTEANKEIEDLRQVSSCLSNVWSGSRI